ncbi:hypothetical protein CerSpe_281970 [Prunus speciosa]
MKNKASLPRHFLLLLLLPSAVVFTVAATTSLSNLAYPNPTVPDDCSVSDVPVPVRREVYDNDRIFDISHRYVPDTQSWDSRDGLGEFLWLGASMKNGSQANVSMMKARAALGCSLGKI